MQPSWREALLYKRKVGAKEPVAELQAGGSNANWKRMFRLVTLTMFNGIFKGVTQISVLKWNQMVVWIVLFFALVVSVNLNRFFTRDLGIGVVYEGCIYF